MTSQCDVLNITRRLTCRLCGSIDLSHAFSLTSTPLANCFVTKDCLNKETKYFPLDLRLCSSCGHLQLLDVVDPKLLFDNYLYVSGTSSSFVKHFKYYVKEVVGLFHPDVGSLVVDIGSNDGTLLQFFKEIGMRVLGIDPAQNLTKLSVDKGITTLSEFFTLELAKKIRDEYGHASIITANNVFAHIDDLDSVMEGVKELLSTDGVFVFEVSYLGDVCQKLLFDTIYHEHLSYHSVKPLVQFFKKHSMELIDVTRIDTHGGSIRGVVKLVQGKWGVHPSVNEFVCFEDSIELDKLGIYKRFAERLDVLKVNLNKCIQTIKNQGSSIVGFGAPAKATTLMYYLGLSSDVIDFIVDDSPFKQGLYSPGFHIPILPVSYLYKRRPDKRRPDYILLLAWNFAGSIIAKHPEFNGRFIIPIPNVEIR